MFWLLGDLGFKGFIAFLLVLMLMPVGALWIAISDRSPGFLAAILAWIVAVGYPNEWFVNPLEGTPIWILGAIAYGISWLIVVGGSYAIAKELTS